MVRLFLPSAHPKDNRLSITDEKAHYLISVLRRRKGDSLTIFDGTGNCFKTTIVKADRREVITEVIEKYSCNLESPLNITLVQSLLKGEKMDVIIEKTTELGVKEIVPAITERSQLRETGRVKRWRKIAEEASRQSGRSVVPVVLEPVELRKYLTSPAFQPTLQGFIFYEEEGMTLSEVVSSFIPHPSSLLVLIGPEGGFSKEEVQFAEEKGLRVISLGERILKAETAAISAVTLVQYLFGDMG